jgi:hypothetical protein
MTEPRNKSLVASNRFRSYIADLFRSAGYDVTTVDRVSRPIQRPFHLRCVDPHTGETLYLAARTGTRATPRQFNAVKGLYVTPYATDSVRRLYWYHCHRYDSHRVFELTQDGLKEVPNPLAHLLPPPLDRDNVNAARRKRERGLAETSDKAAALN